MLVDTLARESKAGQSSSPFIAGQGCPTSSTEEISGEPFPMLNGAMQVPIGGKATIDIDVVASVLAAILVYEETRPNRVQ